MWKPTLLQRVKVRGRDEVFLVLHVYSALGVADLVPLGRDYFIEQAGVDMLEAAEDEAEAA